MLLYATINKFRSNRLCWWCWISKSMREKFISKFITFHSVLRTLFFDYFSRNYPTVLQDSVKTGQVPESTDGYWFRNPGGPDINLYLQISANQRPHIEMLKLDRLANIHDFCGLSTHCPEAFFSFLPPCVERREIEPHVIQIGPQITTKNLTSWIFWGLSNETMIWSMSAITCTRFWAH
jgi:hypothetical protein